MKSLRTALLLLACLAIPAADATTYYVNGTTGNDAWNGRCETWDGGTCGPKKTIQAGINVAVNGDTVIIADGTYRGTGNRNLTFQGRQIAVRSANGAEQCVIDCQNAARGFTFTTQEGPSSILEGITIINGRANDGGAIYCQDTSPTIRRCVLRKNFVTRGDSYARGGAIFLYQSQALISECVIEDNAAQISGAAEGGGGIYCSRGSPTIRGCLIRHNRINGTSGSVSGGGLLCGSTTQVRIEDCVIRENQADDQGGGIYIQGPGATIVRSTIAENYALRGAGIYTFDAVTITDSLICANIARNEGGGLYLGQGTPKIYNCTVRDNIAEQGGGISAHALLNLIHCNILNNSATRLRGGGIWCADQASLLNCILRSNRGVAGIELALWQTAQVTVRHCDVQGGQAAVGLEGNAVLNWSDGNIDADPAFAFAENHRLQRGSPCIDAGAPRAPDDPPLFDPDGNARAIDGNGDGIALPDIGAYEFTGGQPALALATTAVDFFVLQGQAETASQTVTLRNCGGGTLAWQMTAACPWLTIHPEAGESIGEIDEARLEVDANGLAHGIYSCTVEVANNGSANSPRTIAVTLHVNVVRHVPTEYPVIQLAIDATTVDGDIVELASGVYLGTGNRDLDFRGRNLIVRSAPNAPFCIIDCQGAARTFRLQSGEGLGARIEGVTLRNGVGPGGAVFCERSSVSVVNCFIEGCTAPSGGGGAISVSQGRCDILNTRFGPNTANYGAALAISDGKLTMTGCIVQDQSGAGAAVSCGHGCLQIVNCDFARNSNSVTEGGAVSTNSCELSVQQSQFEENFASNDGGAIYAYGNTDISDCRFSDNRSGQDGGGVFSFGGTNVKRCYFEQNLAGNAGGGLYMELGGLVSDCSFLENQAARGGGMDAVSGLVSVQGCTMSGNHAQYTGGGVMLYNVQGEIQNCLLVKNIVANCIEGGAGLIVLNGAAIIRNCTIADNSLPGSCQRGGGVAASNAVPEIINCILWNNGPNEIYGNPTVRYSNVRGGRTGQGNINADPLFVNPSASDYHLIALSPCIDAGDPAYNFSLEPEPDGGRINMGFDGNTPEAATKGWLYIDGYQLDSRTRVGRTVFDYVLQVRLRNASDQAASNVVLELLSAPPNVQILENIVNISAVPAGGTVMSSDPFIIRVDRTTLVAPLPISWRITYSGGSGEFTTLLETGTLEGPPEHSNPTPDTPANTVEPMQP